MVNIYSPRVIGSQQHVAARNEITEAKLRRLARLRANGPRVLSVYLDLDPERFATPPARASEVDSLLDEASRRIESEKHPHEELEQLRADLDRLRDPVHGQHDQGGWSQARYQRSVEHDVDAHLRHTAEVLLRQFERKRFVGLLLAAPEELRLHVAEKLHPYVRDQLVGYLALDVE